MSGNGSTLPVVRLRAIEPEDLDTLYTVENDTETWGVGVTNVPYSRYILHDYIASNSGDIYTDRQVRLMMENEAGETVGIIDITNFDPQHRRAEIGVIVKREYRRKGYATAALTETMRYSLNILHLHQLFAVIGKENVASLELFQKMGFEHKSELSDWFFDGKKYSDAILFQFFL